MREIHSYIVRVSERIYSYKREIHSYEREKCYSLQPQGTQWEGMGEREREM